MKTILVTGGTDGIGKGIVLKNLKEGNRVFAVGSREEKGKALIEEARQIGAGERIIFLQANLSLVKENMRVAKEIRKQTDSLDELVLCAASLKPRPAYMETEEGFEFTFALYYLSRHILCFQLKDILEKGNYPVIINVCAPGLTYGKIDWDDIQRKQNYSGQDAQFEGSRLNDLLGVYFTEKDTVRKIKYILFNPMAAKTNGASQMAGDKGIMKWMMKLYYKFAGKTVSEVVEIIYKDVEKTEKVGLTAYKLEKMVNLGMETYNRTDAERLNQYTSDLLKSLC